MCQEVGHTFGLDHQDENFDNANLGTCMDYTSDPDGPPSNLHPNQHDYDELAIIYAHLDGTTTVSSSVVAGGSGQGQSAWGQAIRTSAGARPSMFVLELRGDRAVFTFVIWAR
jgi:hypothetical protein